MKLFSFLNSGHERSVKIKKNSLQILICKGLTMIIGIVLLPLTIGFVSSETYGVWLAISSIVGWLSVFDIGLGHGLRNKFTQSIAVGDTKLAQQYVSTTYAMLCFIFIPILIIFLLINPFINWERVLNVSIGEDLNLIMAIVVAYFSFDFILGTIKAVLYADQRPGDSAIRVLIQQLFVLITIFIMTRVTNGSLLKLSIALCVIPLVVLFFFNIQLFGGRYKEVRPTVSNVRLPLVKDLLSLSIKFFLLQSAALILFQMTNFIIIHYYSAEDVTLYNIAHKYFSVPQTIFATMTTPIWAAVADAVARNELSWIRNSLKRYSMLLGLFVAGELLMLLLCNPVYHLWLGDKVGAIPFVISTLCMLSSIVGMSTSIFVNALSGASYLKLQLISVLLSPLLFLLLCYLFIKVMSLDVYCIPLASLIANFYGAFIAPIQCYQVFVKRKGGIWTA